MRLHLSNTISIPLPEALRQFNEQTPASWMATGVAARKDLHGLLRYPAMMVPQMQADILEAIICEVGRDVHVVDPFVGSGTIMTEAMRRRLDFTGVDINPLAILTCQAKAAIEKGVGLDSAVVDVIEHLKKDTDRSIDVDFHKQEKWFTPEQSQVLSQMRRGIMKIKSLPARQCLWIALAETIRSCSRSRTSTYKLHKRPDGDVVTAKEVKASFEKNLYNMLERVSAYRKERGERRMADPAPELICADVHTAQIEQRAAHGIVITSPPYGDNRTTIPYGQFSYLALNWIPMEDMPHIPAKEWLANAAAIDTASLGGSLRDAETKSENAKTLSTAFARFYAEASSAGKESQARKVGVFIDDFSNALASVREKFDGPSHWVITSGNRRVGDIAVPFDEICEELVENLGGSRIETVKRKLPVKRMPTRNSQGALMTAETTLISSFD